MKKVTYDALYNKNTETWVLWKNVECDRGIYCIPIYKGNKKSVFLLKKILKSKFSLYN